MKENNSDYTRRKFLTAAASGLAAAGLATVPGGVAVAQEVEKAGEKSVKKIISRELGRTGIRLPIVSYGSGSANNPSIIQASYEIGVRHFDTAANYQYGANEQLVGGVLKKMGVRDKAIIGSKIYTPAQRSEMTAAQAKEKFMALTDGSLARLKTDYIDIMYLHDINDGEVITDPAVMEGFAHIKEMKKVRFLGVSTHTNTAEVINAAASAGIYDVILTPVNFTMADDTTLLNAIKNAADKGIGIVAMKVMAGGSPWPDPESRQNYSSSTIAGAALKWVMNNKNIATSIPAWNNYEHMNENFSVAYDLEFTPEERKFLGDNKVKLSVGFCRQCRKCLASCPNGVEVPTLMRTHMYAAQYTDFYLARETLDAIPQRSSIQACVSCDTCLARCANAVDIARRIDELKLMYT